jgi:hypothetical protein
VPDLPNANKVYLLIFDILKNAKNWRWLPVLYNC